MLDVMGLFARLVPFSLGSALARRLLSVLGFGAGTEVGRSGEIAAMARALAAADLNKDDRMVFFDVGANIGEWTLAALRAFPNIQVYAFEPSATHQLAFKAAVGSNAAVQLEPFALAAIKSTATLYKDMSISGLASLTQRDLSHVGIDMNLTENVQTETLDNYIAGLPSGTTIDFLKIDVEGHEFDVLKGAANAMSSRRIRVIQFEFGGTNIDTRTFFKDFYNLLINHGYVLHVIRPGGLLARIDRYREFYEQFRTTNYIAILQPNAGRRLRAKAK